jgi:hypothetical protein
MEDRSFKTENQYTIFTENAPNIYTILYMDIKHCAGYKVCEV